MKRVVACTLVSALMAGCGGGGSGSDLEKTSGNTTPDTGNEDNGAVTPSDQITVLEGTWNKQCGPVEGETHHDIVTVSFTGGTFASSIENYIDSGCSIPFQEAPNPTSSGNFALGDDILLSDGLTATELDTHITQFDGAHFDINEYSIIYIDNDIFYTAEGTTDSTAQRPTSLDYGRPFYRIN